MGSMENLLEYMLKGALVLTGLVLAIIILGPVVIGYGIVMLFLKIADAIRDHLPKPVHRLSKDDLKRMEREIWAHQSKPPNRIIIQEKKPEEKTEILIKKDPPQPYRQAKALNLREGLFYVKDLTEDQIEICKNNGYVELTTNPFGPGKGPRVLIRAPNNQSPIHYYFCRILKSEIEKYGHNALMYISVKPDVVADNIAFEVETGSHYRKKDLRDKFRRAKAGYSDYYILVTKRELRDAYAPYGKVITRNDIKKTISRLYPIQPES